MVLGVLLEVAVGTRLLDVTDVLGTFDLAQALELFAQRLLAAAATPAAPPATQATARQATPMPRLRIEVRMPETYLNPAALVDGHCAW